MEQILKSCKLRAYYKSMDKLVMKCEANYESMEKYEWKFDSMYV